MINGECIYSYKGCEGKQALSNLGLSPLEFAWR